MPELPEVETVARNLREGKLPLLGRTIKSVEVLWQREVQGVTPHQFGSRLANAKVTGVGRHGKYLMIQLNTSDTLFVHLKMSGRLDVVPRAEAYTKHARVVWLLDKNLALRFDDARKFGRVWLPQDPQAILGPLGPDAQRISEEEFVTRLAKKKGALKPILLDQHFIAGVGNIYADESLHLAKLHPKMLASQLTEAQARRLYQAVQLVLAEGIRANGASFDWVYPDGSFSREFQGVWA
ncbi:MAG: DNA-formamidopyrimidine glycosylase, partial [Anaerolineae bacterium]|nr:DNA-formamidopyrimidine glycosylase [Anaerolineae bacterium]